MKTWMKATMMAAMAWSALQADPLGKASNATIPFAFQVENRQMLAGNYKVSRLAPGVFALTHQTGRMAAFQASIQNTAKGQEGRLTFHCAAEFCTPASIHIGGETVSFQRAIPVAPRGHTPTVAVIRLVTP